MSKTLTLWWDHTGPLIQYSRQNSMLHVIDLNPEAEMHWKVSRMEMLRIGWRFIRAALPRW
jgi:hypothetical protein